jgi:hypothetical protein
MNVHLYVYPEFRIGIFYFGGGGAQFCQLSPPSNTLKGQSGEIGCPFNDFYALS